MRKDGTLDNEWADFTPTGAKVQTTACFASVAPFEGLIVGYPDVRDVLILTLVAFCDILLAQIICTYCNTASGGRL